MLPFYDGEKIMTSGRLRFVLVLMYLMLLPSCGRLIDWGKNSFYQGEPVNVDRTIAQNNMRSVAVYDQFTTRAIFDALLLSDEVRTVYAQIYSRKLGKNQDEYSAFLRRQLEENKHYLSFYVLSLYEKPLGEATSEWALFLRVNGTDIAPDELKEVELPLEYQLLFGKRFNRFKIVYSVKFALHDLEDNMLISPDAPTIALIFRAMDKEAALVWDFQPLKNVRFVSAENVDEHGIVKNGVVEYGAAEQLV
jgi:hypothetical protein